MSDASTKQSLLRALRVAEAYGFGLNIRVTLDRAGEAMLLIEPLAVPDPPADSGFGDDAEEQTQR
ncbi:MAG: hypothetical protein K8R60_06145 [Burkholderiales bacterium]|nr:hypothetical protein [Burkholderiales bacterium]